jgi:archaeal flagellar protein FlaI
MALDVPKFENQKVESEKTSGLKVGGLKVPSPIINTNPLAPSLLRQDDKTKINVRYALIVPYVSCHIYWNQEIGEVVYEIEEPLLNDKEFGLLNEIENAMTEMINMEMVSKQDIASVLAYLDKMTKVVLDELGQKLEKESYSRIFYYIYRDFIGFNEIEPLLRDSFIEDIECNGINSPIYIVHRNFRNLRTNIIYDSMDKIASFVEKLAQKCGRYVSYSNPLLDGTLPDGSRVNATYTTDISSKGPTFTIRKFTKAPITPIQLLGSNTLSPEMLAYFWILMQYKCNVLITGSTGSGKTTLLNAIAFFIPPEARVVSIEDTRELQLPRENWLPSVARSGLGGMGEVDLFTLLRESFRQNPDYVIVGEVRGKEAYVLFQGMASGHPSLATIHADSVDSVIKRLETQPINLSPTLLNILDVIAVMTHAVVKKQEYRRLKEVIEIVNVESSDKVESNTVFKWNPREDSFYFKTSSNVFKKICERYGLNEEKLLEEFETRTKLLYELFKNGILEFHEIQKVIVEYYKNPDETLKKFQIKI